MSLEAGSVWALLGGKFVPSGFSQFDAALKKAARDAGAAEKAIVSSHRRTGQSMTAMGQVANKGAAIGLAAVGAAAVFSVKKAMDFEKAMSEVQAVTKANARDFKRLGDSAKDLGAKTGVGATAAAGALAELAKGGLSTEQTIGALNGTIAMSQAGGMDLSEAANTVAQALNLFAMKGEDAAHVADAFAQAANKTTADVSFFSQGLAQGGAAAKAAGLSFDETTVALEVMAANGFKSGSDAGTSLKTALTQLAHPTKQAREEAKKLGLEFFDQNGEMKSLTQVSSMLRDKMGGLTRQQRLAAAATLVGQDGMRALLALYDQGPKKIDRFARANKEQGVAQDVARTKMDNLAGDWKKLQANLETAGINIGTKLIPKLRDLSQGLSDLTKDFDKGDPGSTGGTLRWITDHLNDLGPTLPGMIKDVTDQWQYLQDAVSGWKPPTVDLTPKFARTSLPQLRDIKVDTKLAPIVQKIIADDSSPRQKLAALRALKIPDKVARFILQSGGVDAAIARIVARLAGVKNPPPMVVRVKDEASQILNNIVNKPLRTKVAKILADDSSVQEKVAALMALGISGPTANFLANTGGITDARSKIQGERLNVPVQYVPNVLKPTLPGSLTVPVFYKPANKIPGNAAGRGPGAHEASLVGEGAGPELVGNPQDGWHRVSAPTIMGLRSEDYVIPTESRFRGRAVQLMADALGLPGFKGGKKGTFKGKGKKRRYIPGPLERFQASPDDLKDELTHAQQRYDGLKSDSQQKKDGKLTKGAKKAKRQLGPAHDKLLKAKEIYRQANEYAAKITRQEDLAEIARSDMTLADQNDDQKAYNAAQKRRKARLGDMVTFLRAAMEKAPKGSKWRRELQKRLRQAQVDQGDTAAETMDVEAPGTFTGDQQTRLDQIDAAIATADLTETKTDDIAALTDKEKFLEPLLAQAQSAGRSTAVTEIAGLLKSTRDALGEATKPPDLTADQQLTTDQAYKRGVADTQAKGIDRIVSALTGDGAAQRNAPSVVFQSYVPPSPQEARRLADYTVGGIGGQGGRPAASTKVGV